MQKSTKYIIIEVVLIAGLGSVFFACSDEARQSQKAKEQLAPSLAIKEVTDTSDAKDIRASAFAVGTHATHWQLSHLDNFDYINMPSRMKQIADPKNWIQAAFYIGLTRWADTVEDQTAVKTMGEIAKDSKYQLAHRPMHADDHAIGQMYLWLYQKTGNKATYAHTQETFDNILANPPTVSLEFDKGEVPRPSHPCQDRWCWAVGLCPEAPCQYRWCWADALFMAPRTWMQLTTVTGDQRYLEYADKEYWTTVDYLFSDDYGLFFRDSRFFTKKSDNGNPVFWSRGNGWVFAGLPLIIEEIPQDHPSKRKYLALYRKMAKALIKVQNPNGFWPASLMDADKVKTPETSGTGFITFGLAWGVNNGYFTEKEIVEAVKKGWAALASSVDKKGMLHWVQQIGRAPDPVKENDTQLYGVGALLLAASEMTKWEATPKKVMAYGRFVPERSDDFAWENDKVAFRVYGPAAPQKGHSSGVDSWFKKVEYSIIDKWYAGHLKGVSYHTDHGEGYDPYHTGISRGTGGSAIWVEGKAYSAHNYISYEVIKSGGDEVVFNLQYEWETPLGVVAESKTISLALGEQLYQVNSVFSLYGKPAVLPIAVGLTTHDEKAKVSFNKVSGRISTWETIDKLGVGTGALLEPSIITDIQHIPSGEKDESHIWIFTNSDKQGKLSYRAGFAWQAAGDITDSLSWDTYLDSLIIR